ncbi:MAG: EamA family transporter [Anaeromyxobacteraceae bacterium]|nr:EamA family transporter [Anaeromyxobacteraceae bacterium]
MPPAAPAHPVTGSTLFLFLVPTGIWGTTWLVIKFQLGQVAPEASVAWRFALASGLILAWCAARGVALPRGWRQHLRLVALGVLLFGLNYVLTYRAETSLTSGLVAVLFATMVFWNLLGARLAFGTPAPGGVVLGAVIGLAGLLLLFWPELAGLRADDRLLAGVGYAVAGTLVASAGNLVSQRVFAGGVPVVPGTGVAMGYATLLLLGWCLATGVPLTFDARPAYLLSLAYLAVLGSIVAFVTYLTLLQRIGAGRAGYTTAVIPVVAMLASTLFEQYRWSASAVAGLGLVLAGTVLVLRAKARAAAPARG